jgi:hypothetical protein
VTPKTTVPSGEKEQEETPLKETAVRGEFEGDWNLYRSSMVVASHRAGGSWALLARKNFPFGAKQQDETHFP